jgi:HEAT repeat protein
MLGEGERRDVHLKRAMMRALAAIDDARGTAAIVRALASDDVYLRDAAIEVLAEAAGQDFGLDARQAPEAAAEKIQAARQWWSKKYGKEWAEE